MWNIGHKAILRLRSGTKGEGTQKVLNRETREGIGIIAAIEAKEEMSAGETEEQNAAMIGAQTGAVNNDQKEESNAQLNGVENQNLRLVAHPAQLQGHRCLQLIRGAVEIGAQRQRAARL